MFDLASSDRVRAQNPPCLVGLRSGERCAIVSGIMKRVFVMMVAAACLMGCHGCGTTGQQGTAKVRISVLSEGKLSVNDRVTTTPKLAKTVKAAGARPTTAIEVSIPLGAPQEVMVAITRELRQAGYTKILFVRPRQARVVIPK